MESRPNGSGRDSFVYRFARKEFLMPPTSANGKICYIQIPTTDIQRSAEFYRKVFGWRIRQRGDGRTAFDDTTGQVSGEWVLGRPASAEPGLLIYIMVDSVAEAMDAVVAGKRPDTNQRNSIGCNIKWRE